jgi:hypothetical protein
MGRCLKGDIVGHFRPFWDIGFVVSGRKCTTQFTQLRQGLRKWVAGERFSVDGRFARAQCPAGCPKWLETWQSYEAGQTGMSAPRQGDVQAVR